MQETKLSVYTASSISNSLRRELKGLASSLSERPLAKSEESLIVTLTDQELVGFCNINLKDNIAFLRNIVVKEAKQRQGYGRILLHKAMQLSQDAKALTMQLACKDAHIGFFKNFGYVTIESPNSRNMSEYFLMEHPCPNFYLKHIDLGTLATDNPSLMSLSEDTNLYRYSSEKDYLDLHASQLSQARKEIWFLCDSINNPAISNSYTSQCLLKLIRRNQKANIRLLLANDKTGAGYFNPTIALAQRLSSYIEIRTLQNTGLPFKEMITLIDHTGSIVRQSQSSFQGNAYFNNRLLSKRLRDKFEQQWHYAKPSLHHKRLAL